MTKESDSHNIGNEAKPETSVIFFDGIKLAGLTKLRKEVLQLLIDRSLKGEPVSKTGLEEVYEADGVRKAGKNSIVDLVVRLNEILRNRNLNYAIKNLTSSREKQQGIEASYFLEDHEKQPQSSSAPIPETASPENPKAKLISKEVKNQIALTLTLNVLSYVAKGETTRLNRLVQIHMQKATLSQGVTFLDIFGDMSQD